MVQVAPMQVTAVLVLVHGILAGKNRPGLRYMQVHIRCLLTSSGDSTSPNSLQGSKERQEQLHCCCYLS